MSRWFMERSDVSHRRSRLRIKSRLYMLFSIMWRDCFHKAIALATALVFFTTTLGTELAWALNLPNAVLSASGTTVMGSPGHLLPSKLGQIKEIYAGPNPKTIIYIQDAHCNYSCQKSINEIIGRLNNEYAIDTALLEGGAGDYDLSIFTDIKDAAIREKAADYFVKEGRLNGAEFFAINNPAKIKLEGLEEAGLYHKNLSSYRDSLKFKKDVDTILSKLTSNLSKKKESVYSEELKEFENIRASYSNNELEFDKYLDYLNALSEKLNLSISRYKNLKGLMEAKEKEKDIDFKKANYERDALIKNLEKRLSRMEIETLITNSILFNKERLNQREFYSYLFKKAATVGIEIEKDFPNLCGYRRYIERFESIDRWVLFEEIDNFEEDVIDKLCGNEAQKRLYALSKNLALLKGLFNISLTPEEYRYYQENRHLFKTANFMEVIDTAPGNIKSLDRYAEEMEEFYRYAFERDTAFIENVNRYYDEPLSPSSLRGVPLPKVAGRRSNLIIITGGFHTVNLKELLKKEGYSYIIILPRFDPAEKTPYLKLLSGSLSPVEEAINARKSAVAIGSPVGHLGTEISKEAIDAITRPSTSLGTALSKTAESGRVEGRTSPASKEEEIVDRLWREAEATITAVGGEEFIFRLASINPEKETVKEDLVMNIFVKEGSEEKFIGYIHAFVAEGLDWEKEMVVRSALYQNQLVPQHLLVISPAFKIADEPHYKNRGIGRTALSLLLRIAQRKKVSRVLIEDVGLKRLNFYLELGFKLIGSIDAYDEQEGGYCLEFSLNPEERNVVFPIIGIDEKQTREKRPAPSAYDIRERVKRLRLIEELSHITDPDAIEAIMPDLQEMADTSDLAVSAYARQMMKRLEERIRSKHEDRRSKEEDGGGIGRTSPVEDLPPDKGLARKYRVWKEFDKAGDISAVEQHKIGVEKVKVEHLASLVDWIRDQYQRLEIFLPSLKQINPARNYDDPLVLDGKRLIQEGAKPRLYSDLLFVIDNGVVKLKVVRQKGLQIEEYNSDEISLFINDFVVEPASQENLSLLIKELQGGYPLKDILRLSTRTSPMEKDSKKNLQQDITKEDTRSVPDEVDNSAGLLWRAVVDENWVEVGHLIQEFSKQGYFITIIPGHNDTRYTTQPVFAGVNVSPKMDFLEDLAPLLPITDADDARDRFNSLLIAYCTLIPSSNQPRLMFSRRSANGHRLEIVIINPNPQASSIYSALAEHRMRVGKFGKAAGADVSIFEAVIPIRKHRTKASGQSIISKKHYIRMIPSGSYATVHLVEKNKRFIVHKQASGRGYLKLRQELKWLQSLPDSLRELFPEITGAYFDKNIVWMEQQYYPWPSISQLMLNDGFNDLKESSEQGGKLAAERIWKYLLGIYHDISEQFHSNKIEDIPADFFERFYSNKVRARLEEALTRDPELAATVNSSVLEVDGRKIVGCLALIPLFQEAQGATGILNPAALTLTHGDLNIGNILVNPVCLLAGEIKPEYKLVDPRGWIDLTTGRLTGQDPMYDFAKIVFHFFGNWDMIRHNIYLVNILPSTVETPFPRFHLPSSAGHQTYDYLIMEFKNSLAGNDLVFPSEKDRETAILRLLFTHALCNVSDVPFALQGGRNEHIQALTQYVVGSLNLNQSWDLMMNLLRRKNSILAATLDRKYEQILKSSLDGSIEHIEDSPSRDDPGRNRGVEGRTSPASSGNEGMAQELRKRLTEKFKNRNLPTYLITERLVMTLLRWLKEKNYTIEETVRVLRRAIEAKIKRGELKFGFDPQKETIVLEGLVNTWIAKSGGEDPVRTSPVQKNIGDVSPAQNPLQDKELQDQPVHPHEENRSKVEYGRSKEEDGGGVPRQARDDPAKSRAKREKQNRGVEERTSPAETNENDSDKITSGMVKFANKLHIFWLNSNMVGSRGYITMLFNVMAHLNGGRLPEDDGRDIEEIIADLIAKSGVMSIMEVGGDAFLNAIEDIVARVGTDREIGDGPERGTPQDEGRTSPITLEEIEVAIDDINKVERKIIFDENKKHEIAQKLMTMGLEKGKSFLVVGPGALDYLPILLAKLDLQVSAIDTNAEQIKGLSFGLDLFKLKNKVEIFTSYENLENRQFDYISLFGVLHHVYNPNTDKQLKDFIDRTTTTVPQSQKAALTRDAKEYCRKKMQQAITPIIDRLNPNGGLIFINVSLLYPHDKFLIEKRGADFYRRELDYVDYVLELLGQERGIFFDKRPEVDINDFSAHPHFFTEKRQGVTYKARQIEDGLERDAPQSEGRTSPVGKDSKNDLQQDITEEDTRSVPGDVLNKILNGEYVTEESISLQKTLAELGPEIERYIRQRVGDEAVKIAIVPLGSSLKGYAVKGSDIEYIILVLRGQDIKRVDGGEITWRLNELIEKKAVRSEPFLTVPKAIPSLEPVVRGEVTMDSFEKEDDAFNYLSALFLPVVYGDRELVDRARRNVVAFASRQKSPEEFWSRLQEHYYRRLEIESDLLAKKPHLKQWVALQGVNPNSEEDVRKFNEERKKAIGLPGFSEMRNMYGVESETEQKESEAKKTDEAKAKMPQELPEGRTSAGRPVEEDRSKVEGGRPKEEDEGGVPRQARDDPERNRGLEGRTSPALGGKAEEDNGSWMVDDGKREGEARSSPMKRNSKNDLQQDITEEDTRSVPYEVRFMDILQKEFGHIIEQRQPLQLLDIGTGTDATFTFELNETIKEAGINANIYGIDPFLKHRTTSEGKREGIVLEPVSLEALEGDYYKDYLGRFHIILINAPDFLELRHFEIIKKLLTDDGIVVIRPSSDLAYSGFIDDMRILLSEKWNIQILRSEIIDLPMGRFHCAPPYMIAKPKPHEFIGKWDEIVIGERGEGRKPKGEDGGGEGRTSPVKDVPQENAALQQPFEFFRRYGSAFEYSTQRASFYRFRTMQRDDRAATEIAGVDQNNVAAFLPADDKSGLLESSHNTLAGDLRQGWDGQAETSTSSRRTSDSGMGRLSSFNVSRYNSMASLAFLRHSSIVSPSVVHPESAGTTTENPPLGSLSSMILNLRNIVSRLLYKIKYILSYRRSQAGIRGEAEGRKPKEEDGGAGRTSPMGKDSADDVVVWGMQKGVVPKELYRGKDLPSERNRRWSVEEYPQIKVEANLSSARGGLSLFGKTISATFGQQNVNKRAEVYLQWSKLTNKYVALRADIEGKAYDFKIVRADMPSQDLIDSFYSNSPFHRGQEWSEKHPTIIVQTRFDSNGIVGLFGQSGLLRFSEDYAEKAVSIRMEWSQEEEKYIALSAEVENVKHDFKIVRQETAPSRIIASYIHFPWHHGKSWSEKYPRIVIETKLGEAGALYLFGQTALAKFGKEHGGEKVRAHLEWLPLSEEYVVLFVEIGGVRYNFKLVRKDDEKRELVASFYMLSPAHLGEAWSRQHPRIIIQTTLSPKGTLTLLRGVRADFGRENSAKPIDVHLEWSKPSGRYVVVAADIDGQRYDFKVVREDTDMRALIDSFYDQSPSHRGQLWAQQHPRILIESRLDADSGLSLLGQNFVAHVGGKENRGKKVKSSLEWSPISQQYVVRKVEILGAKKRNYPFVLIWSKGKLKSSFYGGHLTWFYLFNRADVGKGDTIWVPLKNYGNTYLEPRSQRLYQFEELQEGGGRIYGIYDWNEGDPKLLGIYVNGETLQPTMLERKVAKFPYNQEGLLRRLMEKAEQKWESDDIRQSVILYAIEAMTKGETDENIIWTGMNKIARRTFYMLRQQSISLDELKEAKGFEATQKHRPRRSEVHRAESDETDDKEEDADGAGRTSPALGGKAEEDNGSWIRSLLFMWKKSHDLFKVVKDYYEALKDIFSTQKVKAYIQPRRESYGGRERDLADLYREGMVKDGDESAVSYDRRGWFAFLIFYAKRIGLFGGKDGIESAGINISVHSDIVDFDRDNGTGNSFMGFVRKLYRTVSAHMKSWGWGTRKNKGMVPGYLALAFSTISRGVPSASVKARPMSSTMITYPPAYFSTNDSRFSPSQVSASNPLRLLPLEDLAILPLSLDIYIPSLNKSQGHFGIERKEEDGGGEGRTSPMEDDSTPDKYVGRVFQFNDSVDLTARIKQLRKLSQFGLFFLHKYVVFLRDSDIDTDAKQVLWTLKVSQSEYKPKIGDFDGFNKMYGELTEWDKRVAVMSYYLYGEFLTEGQLIARLDELRPSDIYALENADILFSVVLELTTTKQGKFTFRELLERFNSELTGLRERMGETWKINLDTDEASPVDLRHTVPISPDMNFDLAVRALNIALGENSFQKAIEKSAQASQLEKNETKNKPAKEDDGKGKGEARSSPMKEDSMEESYRIAMYRAYTRNYDKLAQLLSAQEDRFIKSELAGEGMSDKDIAEAIDMTPKQLRQMRVIILGKLITKLTREEILSSEKGPTKKTPLRVEEHKEPVSDETNRWVVPDVPQEIKDKDLFEYIGPLSARVRRVCIRFGMMTVEDALRHHPHEFRDNLRNFGEKSMNELWDKMAARGLWPPRPEKTGKGRRSHIKKSGAKSRELGAEEDASTLNSQLPTPNLSKTSISPVEGESKDLGISFDELMEKIVQTIICFGENIDGRIYLYVHNLNELLNEHLELETLVNILDSPLFDEVLAKRGLEFVWHDEEEMTSFTVSPSNTPPAHILPTAEEERSKPEGRGSKEEDGGEGRTSPAARKILNDEAREKMHEIMSRWDAVKEKIRNVEGYDREMTLDNQMMHVINSAKSLIENYEQSGDMRIDTVQNMIEELNKTIECARFIKEAIQQHTIIPRKRAFIHHKAFVLYAGAITSQEKGELRDSHIQELSVLIEEIPRLIPDYESLKQILEQIPESRTSPIGERRLFSTQEVYGNPLYVLRRYLVHEREFRKAHNVSPQEIKRQMQKAYKDFGKTAPQDGPREGFIRVLSDEDIQEAVKPMPDFLLENITYRRYEASSDIFGPGLIYFPEVYPDGKLLKGEILIPDIPAGLLYKEAQSWVDSKIFAPTGPLYTEADRIAFCREGYKLAITHEIGELFSMAMHTSMDIWFYLPERFMRKNKVVDREKTVRGLVVGDPRHEFCDSLMVYFWPEQPLLRNTSFLEAEKKVIAQLLELASKKPKGAYFVSNHVEKFMERITGLSIIDRTWGNSIYFKSIFDASVLQEAAEKAGLILYRHSSWSEGYFNIYDGENKCAVVGISVSIRGKQHTIRLKRDISIPSLEKIEKFINILAGSSTSDSRTSPIKETPSPLPSPLRGEGIETAIQEQFRILTEEVPYRKAQYTIGVVVKARPGDEGEIERCRRYAQEIEQDGRRLGALIGITRGISEEDRANIRFVPYIDDGTMSDENLARIREFSEKIRIEREKNPDGVVFSFVLNGRNLQDAAYTVALDGEFVSGWSQMLLGPLFAVYIHSKLEEIDKTDGENMEATIEAIVKSIEAMKATVDTYLRERLRKVQNKDELAALFNGSLVLHLPPIAPESQDNLEALRRTECETGAAL